MTATESSATDRIHIKGLSAFGFHGVLPEERLNGQNFIVDLELEIDSRPASLSDDLAQTVNYAEISDEVVALIQGPAVNLIETLAARIAEKILHHDAVQRVSVQVNKPNAPINQIFSNVSITITRTRQDFGVFLAADEEPIVESITLEELTKYPAPEPAVPLVAQVPEFDDPTPKPAPLPDRLDEVPQEPVDVIIGLGANLGDAQETLKQAINDIANLSRVELVAIGPLAKTAPVGGDEKQPDFLNTVIKIKTTRAARDLLVNLLSIEDYYGRIRAERWGPRTLDLDLITYGQVAFSSDDLEIPHPRAHARSFVLTPWVHIEPEANLPGLGGGPISQLEPTAPDREGIRWLAIDWLSGRELPDVYLADDSAGN